MKRRKAAAVFFAVSIALTAIFPLGGCAPQDTNESGLWITFNFNDDYYRSQFVFVDEDGLVEDAPRNPVRTGYDFVGWTTQKDGGTMISFPYTITESTTLYAQWEKQKCNVFFDWNCDDVQAEAITIEKYYGDTLLEREVPAENAIPERDGYDFWYWSANPEGTTRAVFPCVIEQKEKNYYATWIGEDISLYTITLHVNYEGGEDPQPLEVVEGQSVNLPALTRPGYDFSGWAAAPEGSDVLASPYTPAGNIELYAQWERKTVIVNFYNNFDSAESKIFKSENVYGGDEVTAPSEIPERPGYKFLGWYGTETGGTVVQFPQVITRRTNYYAHWQSEAVETNIFDAEFTYIDPTKQYPGYSGNATGYGIIVGDSKGVMNADTQREKGFESDMSDDYYVSFMYEYGATVRFVIYSDKAVKGAQLTASLAVEFEKTVTFTPSGEASYTINVNGTALNYGSIEFNNYPDVGSGLYACAFRAFTLGNIDLKAGENIIEFVTTNHRQMGGMLGASAPMIDSITIDNLSGAKLSWKPEYDNIRNRKG